MRHLYLHHDGYPTGAAWRFAEALCEAPEPASFLVAFLNTQPNAEPIQSREQTADAEYRYLVQLVSDADPPPTGAVLATDPRRGQLESPLRAHADGGVHPALPSW